MRASVKFEMPLRYPNGDMGKVVDLESGAWERGEGYRYKFVSHTT